MDKFMFSNSSKTGTCIKLYRYLSHDALVKTISNQSLKFSRPSLFNDPYDNHIPVTNKCDESLLKSNIKMSILNYFSKDGSLKSNSFFYKNLALFFARNPTVLEEIENQMKIPCHNCNELNDLVEFLFTNYNTICNPFLLS